MRGGGCGPKDYRGREGWSAARHCKHEQSQKNRIRWREGWEKVGHLCDVVSQLPVEMYPDCRTKWSSQQQLSTEMCISTSSWDVNPTPLSQLTRHVGTSLQSPLNHKCVSIWGSLGFNVIHQTWRHTCRYKCAKPQRRGPVKGLWVCAAVTVRQNKQEKVLMCPCCKGQHCQLLHHPTSLTGGELVWWWDIPTQIQAQRKAPIMPAYTDYQQCQISIRFPVMCGACIDLHKGHSRSQTGHYLFWHVHMKHIALLCIIILLALILTLGRSLAPPQAVEISSVYAKNNWVVYI